MPDPEITPALNQTPATPAPELTLATASEAEAAAAAKLATETAAKTEAERVAALTPEQRDAETAAKAKTEKEAADKAEAERVAKLTPEQKAAEEKAKAEAEANKVPEKYEFKVPEGVVLDKEITAEFEAAAKELGLSQEKAQKVFDIGTKLVQKHDTTAKEATTALQASWLDAAKVDKEFGGADLQKNLAVAARAMEFATPEMKTILNESKLGNHPEVIRWMFRVGKAMSEDTHREGRPRISAEDSFEAKARKLYPNQT